MGETSTRESKKDCAHDSIRLDRVLPTEEQEQIALVNWFKIQYPQFKDDIHHFANERKCNIIRGSRLKKMGVTAGVADIFLAISVNRETRSYAGLWIELKVRNGKLSFAQQEFLDRKNKMGYLALAAWGFDAAKHIIEVYLKDYTDS